MEFRRSVTPGPSFARSRSHGQNINQESQFFFKKSSSGPGKCPEPTTEQTIVKSTDMQQIIKEKIHTIIPKDQPFSHKDLNPEVSITQDAEGNTILKET